MLSRDASCESTVYSISARIGFSNNPALNATCTAHTCGIATLQRGPYSNRRPLAQCLELSLSIAGKSHPPPCDCCNIQDTIIGTCCYTGGFLLQVFLSLCDYCIVLDNSIKTINTLSQGRKTFPLTYLPQTLFFRQFNFRLNYFAQ